MMFDIYIGEKREFESRRKNIFMDWIVQQHADFFRRKRKFSK